jgi:predicted DNA-binding WGR domain protein
MATVPATARAPTRATLRRTRRADTAGLEIALLERALADGGLLFSRRDPGRQCYYRLSLQPTLFGGLDLVREWGRIGPDPLPRRLVEHYASLAELLPPLSEAVRVRLRHGYRARPLPARFIPSATSVYWSAGLRPG